MRFKIDQRLDEFQAINRGEEMIQEKSEEEDDEDEENYSYYSDGEE